MHIENVITLVGSKGTYLLLHTAVAFFLCRVPVDVVARNTELVLCVCGGGGDCVRACVWGGGGECVYGEGGLCESVCVGRGGECVWGCVYSGCPTIGSSFSIHLVSCTQNMSGSLPVHCTPDHHSVHSV